MEDTLQVTMIAGNRAQPVKGLKTVLNMSDLTSQQKDSVASEADADDGFAQVLLHVV
jgi:hypothetical protein